MNDPTVIETERSRPCCGRVLDRAIVAESGVPIPPVDGDISICAHCLAWLIWESDLPRMLTADETNSLPSQVKTKLFLAEKVIAGMAAAEWRMIKGEDVER